MDTRAEHLTDAQLILELDGELAQSEAPRVHQHLEACESCASRQIEFARLSEQVAACEPRPSLGWRWRWAAGGALATTAALVLVTAPLQPKPVDPYSSFVSLPFSDTALPLENAPVVRVELPVESLRLASFHVGENLAGRRVTADLLLGKDGLPRAIRIVR